MCERNEQAKEKFNRTIVSQLTGLTGEKLGKFIASFLDKKIQENGMTSIEWILSVPDMEKEILNFKREINE